MLSYSFQVEEEVGREGEACNRRARVHATGQSFCGRIQVDGFPDKTLSAKGHNLSNETATRTVTRAFQVYIQIFQDEIE